jgi:hypothetical protein
MTTAPNDASAASLSALQCNLSAAALPAAAAAVKVAGECGCDIGGGGGIKHSEGSSKPCVVVMNAPTAASSSSGISTVMSKALPSAVQTRALFVSTSVASGPQGHPISGGITGGAAANDPSAEAAAASTGGGGDRKKRKRAEPRASSRKAAKVASEAIASQSSKRKKAPTAAAGAAATPGATQDAAAAGGGEAAGAGGGASKLSTAAQLRLEADKAAAKAAAAKRVADAAVKASKEAEDAAKAAEEVATNTITLHDFMSKAASKPWNEIVAVPGDWTASDVQDALELAKAFYSGSVQHSQRLSAAVKMQLLPKSKLSAAYAEIAQNLSKTTCPIFDNSQRASMDARPQTAEQKGLVAEKLGFHGTDLKNIKSIINDGFNAPVIHRNHGPAIYTSRTSYYSEGYSTNKSPPTGTPSSTREMLGCRVLAFAGELFGDFYAVLNPARVLPFVVFRYSN